MLSRCMEMRAPFCLVLISVVCLSISTFSHGASPPFFPNNSPCVFNVLALLCLHTCSFLHHSSCCFSICPSSPHLSHSTLPGGRKPFGFHQHDSLRLKGCASLDSDFVLSSLFTNSCLFSSLHLAFSVLITPQI